MEKEILKELIDRVAGGDNAEFVRIVNKRAGYPVLDSSVVKNQLAGTYRISAGYTAAYALVDRMVKSEKQQ